MRVPRMNKHRNIMAQPEPALRTSAAGAWGEEEATLPAAAAATAPAANALTAAAQATGGANSGSSSTPADTQEDDAPMVALMQNLGGLSPDVYSIAFSSLLLGTRQKGVKAGVVVCMGTLCCALQIMLLYLLYISLTADNVSSATVESDWKLPTSQVLVLTVVYASVAKDYGNALKMMKMLRSGRSVMRFTGSMTKFLGALILPVMQATVAHGVIYLAALIIAQATDTSGVILNGLSVVFVADIDEYVSVRLEGNSAVNPEAEAAAPVHKRPIGIGSFRRTTMQRSTGRVLPMRLETFGPTAEDDAGGVVEAFVSALPHVGGGKASDAGTRDAATAAVAAADAAGVKSWTSPSVVLQIEGGAAGTPAAGTAASIASKLQLKRFARVVHAAGRLYVFAGGLAMLGYCLFQLPGTKTHATSLAITIACFLAAFYFVTPDF